MKRILIALVAVVAATTFTSCEQHFSDTTYNNKLLGIWTIDKIVEVSYENGVLEEKDTDKLTGADVMKLNFTNDNSMTITRTILGQDVVTNYSYVVDNGVLIIRPLGGAVNLPVEYEIEHISRKELVLLQEEVDADSREYTRYYGHR